MLDPPFDNLKLRQAVAREIDKEEKIIERISWGFGGSGDDLARSVIDRRRGATGWGSHMDGFREVEAYISKKTLQERSFKDGLQRFAGMDR
jgi:hypothetical protein